LAEVAQASQVFSDLGVVIAEGDAQLSAGDGGASFVEEALQVAEV
jgi:hypothetical protein